MKVCAGAKPDDGLFMVTWLGETSKLDFLRVFPSVFKGKHVDHHTVDQYVGKKITLDAPDQIAYADGERVGPLPATVELHEGKLHVLVPTNSPIGQ